MVTKAKKNAGRKKKVKVLDLKKETVKNLRGGESRRVKGGLTPANSSVIRLSTQYPSGVGQASIVSGGNASLNFGS